MNCSKRTEDDKEKGFEYFGDYQLIHRMYVFNRGLKLEFYIVDPVDGNKGLTQFHSGMALDVAESPFFEKHYCEDNDALKNWDIGNYGRLVITAWRSMKITLNLRL